MRGYPIHAVALIAGVLGVQGCSSSLEESTDSSSNVEAAKLKPVEKRDLAAKLSCRTSGVNIDVYQCLIASQGMPGGSLKVRSGGNVKMYSELEMLQELGGQFVRIPLKEPFEIIAQTNGRNFVLNMSILDGEKNVFQDEESEHGMIVARSDDIF